MMRSIFGSKIGNAVLVVALAFAPIKIGQTQSDMPRWQANWASPAVMEKLKRDMRSTVMLMTRNCPAIEDIYFRSIKTPVYPEEIRGKYEMIIDESAAVGVFRFVCKPHDPENPLSSDVIDYALWPRKKPIIWNKDFKLFALCPIDKNFAERARKEKSGFTYLCEAVGSLPRDFSP